MKEGEKIRKWDGDEKRQLDRDDGGRFLNCRRFSWTQLPTAIKDIYKVAHDYVKRISKILFGRHLLFCCSVTECGKVEFEFYARGYIVVDSMQARRTYMCGTTELGPWGVDSHVRNMVDQYAPVCRSYLKQVMKENRSLPYIFHLYENPRNRIVEKVSSSLASVLKYYVNDEFCVLSY